MDDSTTRNTPDVELIRRAVATYLGASSGDPIAAAHQIHTAQDTTVDGLRYVVLRAQAGDVLAVFRVRPVDGVLRRMKRWPRALDELDEEVNG